MTARWRLTQPYFAIPTSLRRFVVTSGFVTCHFIIGRGHFSFAVVYQRGEYVFFPPKIQPKTILVCKKFTSVRWIENVTRKIIQKQFVGQTKHLLKAWQNRKHHSALPDLTPPFFNPPLHHQLRQLLPVPSWSSFSWRGLDVRRRTETWGRSRCASGCPGAPRRRGCSPPACAHCGDIAGDIFLEYDVWGLFVNMGKLHYSSWVKYQDAPRIRKRCTHSFWRFGEPSCGRAFKKYRSKSQWILIFQFTLWE